MKLKVESNRMLYLNEKNMTIAEITYTSVNKDLYIIDHTSVENGYQGKGIAKELVRAVVDKARKEGKKVMPLCPFANAEFERRIEYQDVRK